MSTVTDIFDGEEQEGGNPVTGPDENEVKNKIEQALNDVLSLEDQRKSINDKISSIVEDLQSVGVNRHAFAMCRKVMKMSEDQRAGLDLSYMICRTAAHLPVQSDWIKSEEQQNSTDG